MMSHATIVDVKQAIKSAFAFVKGLNGALEGLRLEEVELSNDERHWLITIGFDEPATKSPLKNVLTPLVPGDELNRVYKLIRVDAKTGEALSMKIRQV